MANGKLMSCLKGQVLLISCWFLTSGNGGLERADPVLSRESEKAIQVLICNFPMK